MHCKKRTVGSFFRVVTGDVDPADPATSGSRFSVLWNTVSWSEETGCSTRP